MLKTAPHEGYWFDGVDQEDWFDGDHQEIGPNPFDKPEDLVPSEPGPLETKWSAGEAITKEFCARHEGQLGRAALRTLRDYLRSEVAWATDKHDEEIGPFEAFARVRALAGMAKFFQEFKLEALRIERGDQDERDDAIRNGQNGIARFLQRHAARIRRLQRRYPRRWHVPEHSDEDVRGEIVVETLACFRRDRGFDRYQRLGRAATFQLASSVVKRMQRKRLISIAVTPDLAGLPSFGPTPEEILLLAERERRLAGMPREVERSLSRIQAGWFAGFSREIDLNGKLRLVRVAEHMSRSKAAATEARRAIRDVIKAVGYGDIFE
jgi:hypothetical protein